MEHRNVLTLPESTVVTKEEEIFCYRLESGKAIRTPLQLGLRGNGLVEILKNQTRPAKASEPKIWEDFTGEEEIIESNAAELKDGQTVDLTSGKRNQ